MNARNACENTAISFGIIAVMGAMILVVLYIGLLGNASSNNVAMAIVWPIVAGSTLVSQWLFRAIKKDEIAALKRSQREADK